MFKRLCFIGVGLIGSSMARAARQHQLAETIIAVGQTECLPNLQMAKQIEVIDEYYTDIKQAVENVDCIVIATPVGAVESIFTQLKEYWRDDVIYTDVCSTKGSVIAAAEKVFSGIPDNFVPTHPIAGAESSGAAAGRADLFLEKRLVVTPLPNTRRDALQKITQFWQHIGAFVSTMSVEHHDKVLAATSHLPHVLAFAMVDLLGRKDEQEEIFKYAAGGFKDFSRIASSDPTMWLDICLANKAQILPLIQQLQIELNQIENMLEQEQKQQIFDLFSYARDARQRFLDQLL